MFVIRPLIEQNRAQQIRTTQPEHSGQLFKLKSIRNTPYSRVIAANGYQMKTNQCEFAEICMEQREYRKSIDFRLEFIHFHFVSHLLSSANGRQHFGTEQTTENSTE